MRIIRIIGMFCFLAYQSAAYNAGILDSLLAIEEGQYGSEETKELYQRFVIIANEYKNKEKYPDAIAYFEKAIKVVKNSDHRYYSWFSEQPLETQFKLEAVLYGLGYSYERNSEYPLALKYYTEVLTLDSVENNNDERVKSLSQISSIHQALGNYEKAYDFQTKALQLHEANNNEAQVARSLYMIGTIFFYQHQYESALEYYERAKTISDELKNDRLIYSCLGALGSVHAELGNKVENLYYNDLALELAKRINYKMGIAYAMGNMGATHLKSGDCEKAESFIIKSLQMKEEMKDTWGLIGSKMSLAEAYAQCGQDHKLVPLLEEVILMTKELDAKPRELEAYETLLKYYDKKNNITKAYFYQKKVLALRDTLLNEKTLEEMGQSKQRYELQKKEHEISLLKKENDLFASNQKIQRLQGYMFGIAFLMFLMVSSWLAHRIKFQNNINKLLGDKNDLLNSKNEEIDIKNKQLEHSNQDLQQFAYVASHDLKEPLRMIHSYTSLLKRRYNDKFDDTGREFMHYVVDAVDRMQIMLDDLLDYSRAGSQDLPDKLVDVADMMIIVESNLRHRIETNNGKLIIKNENLPAIKAHSTQVIQLLQNLVSNALKFRGENDPIVTIDCQQKENHYIFSVNDNGIGISEEHLEKVFEVFKRLHTREEYEGTGIGLATCKRIVTKTGGDLWVESTVGEGSTFFFSIPCPSPELVLA